MAVGFDLRAPMLVDASAAIPTRSFMLRRRSDPRRFEPLEASLGLPGFFPIAAAQHENGAHSPTPWAAKRSASISAGFHSALGRSSIRAVGANAGTIGLARHHLFLDWGADGFSRPVSPRPEIQKKGRLSGGLLTLAIARRSDRDCGGSILRGAPEGRVAKASKPEHHHRPGGGLRDRGRRHRVGGAGADAVSRAAGLSVADVKLRDVRSQLPPTSSPFSTTCPNRFAVSVRLSV